MNKKFLSVAAASLFLLMAACGSGTGNSDSGSSDPTAREGWTLVWSDDFDGTELNQEYWSYQYGTGSDHGLDGWGNNEAQYYREENARVEDGNLIITARRESYGGKDYTSARVRTADKVATTFGRIEARIVLPAVDGMWPAFWMLPESSTPYGAWSRSGEIDIMEARGRNPYAMSGALHFGTVHRYESQAKTLKLPITEYHVYALEWNEEEMTWFVDDEQFMHLVARRWHQLDLDGSEAAPFDTDFHILLNLAVGGNFDGGVLPPADFVSAEMKVDYVRIYAENPV